MGEPERDTETPNNSHKKPGKVYMFLQNDFKDYVSRKEDDVVADVVNITTCFRKLGFDVEIPLKNRTKEEIIGHLTAAYYSNISIEYECIFIFFVTHSPMVGQLLCHDDIFQDVEMINIMKGEEHKNLLKLFVFQAPQAIRKPGEGPRLENDSLGIQSSWIPDEANFFVIKSSFEREVSPPENGSYFLKVFCQIMEKIGTETSMFNVMTAVLRDLKANRNKDSKIPRNNILPEVTSTLLKPMFFRSEGKTAVNLTRYDEKDSIGKLIVLNYSYTSRKSMYATKTLRGGSKYDVPAIEKSFGGIGFKVEVNNNLTADDVRDTLGKGRKCYKKSCKPVPNCGLRHKGEDPVDYSNDTCVAVAIMTNGHSSYIQTTNEEMNTADIISRLIISKKVYEERDDLSGKPKLFFIQVCRDSIEREPLNLPLEFDDTLVFHNSYHRDDSSRDSHSGSWFIQELCDRIDSLNDCALLTDILQGVQEKIVLKHGAEHMPVIHSTLTKNLLIKKRSLMKDCT